MPKGKTIREMETIPDIKNIRDRSIINQAVM
jgi:hypothetical protein